MRLLTEEGHEVTTLVRKSSSTELIDGLPVKNVAGDVTDSESLMRGVPDDTEWFFHNAAIMAEWGGRAHFHPVNVEGTQNVLETIRKKNIPRLIYTSSTAVYGFPNKKEPITEDWPWRPSNEYQDSKIAAEDLIRKYMKAYGIKATMVRPPTVLGRGDMYTGPQMIEVLKQGGMYYFGDGSNIQSFVHAEDTARCLILAAEKFDKSSGNAYNVVSFTSRFREFIEALQEGLDAPRRVRKMPYRVAWALGGLLGGLYKAFLRRTGPPLTTFRVKLFGTNYLIDGTKAKEDLGFEPTWNLESTVKDMIEWGGVVKPR